MWGSSSGARSRTPGRSESPSEMTAENMQTQINDIEESSSSDEVRVVAAVVVDEEAIAAGVRAAQYNMLDELRALIDSGSLTANTKDSEDCTLLQWASINNRKLIVQELLDRGAEVNTVGGFLRETALQWAVRQGALETTVILVENGGDPHIQGTEGLNSLHLAIQFKHIDTVLYLCSAHPALLDAPTAPEKGSHTPLMFLVNLWGKQKANRECARKYTDIMRILVSFGAGVNVATKPSGDTAMHMIMRVKNDMDASTMCRELLVSGANLDIKNIVGETPETIAKTRLQKNLSRILQKERLKDRVPGSTGFLAPWLQIFSAAYLTSMFGWFVGCAAFFPACGVLGMLTNLTKKTERNVSHGFAAGSMFFIVGTFFYYLINEVTSPLLLLWYCVSVFLLVYFFVKTTLTEPGFVRAPMDAARAGVGSDLESGLSSSLLGGQSAAESIKGMALSGQLHAALICSTCLIEKPKRSKHCSTCGHCILRFDHHCPFVNTCIGRDNIVYFMGFLVFCSLAIGTHLCIALPFIWNNCHDSSVKQDLILEKLICISDETPNFLLVITALAILHFIWITVLAIAQTCQIAVDITTYEAIRGDKRGSVHWRQLFENMNDVLRGRPSFNDRKES